MALKKIIAKNTKAFANSYIGREGEVFFDPENPVLRYSNGSTAGGIILSGGGSSGLPFLDLTNNPFFNHVFFEKTNYGDEVDEISPGLHITRGEEGWIFNPLTESSHSNPTPTNSLWNNDGWDDLTDIEDRSYTSIRNIWNNNFINIPGAKMILKDTTTNKFYAVEFISWQSGGDGGGFSYNRYEIDLTKLQTGITFADGSRLKSTSDIITSVRSVNDTWRIEEQTGFSEVELEGETVLETYTGVVIENPGNPWDIY